MEKPVFHDLKAGDLPMRGERPLVRPVSFFLDLFRGLLSSLWVKTWSFMSSSFGWVKRWVLGSSTRSSHAFSEIV